MISLPVTLMIRRYLRYGLLLALMGASQWLPAQLSWSVHTQSLYGNPQPARSQIAAPTPAGSRAAATSILNPTYTGLPAPAQGAAQYATDIWAGTLFQAFPITFEVAYVPLAPGELARTSTLMASGFPGSPLPGTAYPAALANGFAGCDLNPLAADFVIQLNDAAPWHTDPLTAPPAGTYDLATVVLRSIALGLGMVASFRYDDGVAPDECLGTPGSGCYGGTPTIFETLVQNQFAFPLRNHTNYSAALGGDLIGDNLFWAGAQGIAAQGGTPPKLYAPVTFVDGQSVIHLDEATYPAGNPHSLLTPLLQVAEVIHDPGDVVRGMLVDMGWTLANTAQAFFTVPTTGYTGEPLAFTDRSPQGLSWAWDFENDGFVDATLQHPTHTYPAPGTYTARLTLNGNPALTFTQTIEVFDLPTIPFTLTFDASGEGFRASQATCLQWEWGTPTTPLLSVFGPIGGSGQSWVTRLAGNHGTNVTYYLESPPIYFVGANGDYFLRFDYRWVAANDAGMNVQYSVDGGNTWQVLGGLQGVDPDADVNWYNQAAIPALDNQPGWQIPILSATVFQVSYRITALAPNPDVRFRIQFAAGSSTPQEGVEVDNFQIQGQVLPASFGDLEPGGEPSEKMALFPNPVQDVLTLRLPEPTGTGLRARLELSDLAGRRCWSRSWDHSAAGEITFSLADLAAGTYLYRWTSGAQVVHGRLLKR